MINKALRLIRTFHDMKQIELAGKLGISKSYVSELEKGTKNPSIEMLNKYANVFEIAASSILFFSENMEPSSSASKRKARQIVSTKVLALLEFIEARRGSDAEEE